MNKFEVQGSGFPADNRTWRFLRDMINTVHELAGIAGDNYILKGCEDDNGVVSPGFVVLGGELLPFQGGALGTEVTIIETIDAVTYLEDIAPSDGQGDIKNAYFTRFARFGNDGVGTTYSWAYLERLNPLLELQRSIPPKKACLPFFGTEADLTPGWVLCNAGNSATHGIPDLSGMFVVGFDPTDTDYNSIGKQGGSKAVTLSEAQMPSHNHTGNITIPPHSHTYQKSVPGRGYDTKADDNPHGQYQNTQTSASSAQNAGFTTGSKGGGQPHENRPPYYTMAYITYVGM